MKYTVEVTATVTVTLDADDRDEAEQLVTDGLEKFDHSMFDTVDVEDVMFDSVVGEQDSDGR